MARRRVEDSLSSFNESAFMIDDRAAYHALKSRDPRFDGLFFVGVASTGIYCRPICPTKTPQQKNCRFFESAVAAEKARFRPCLRCRPELAPGHAPIDKGNRIAHLITRRIDEKSERKSWKPCSRNSMMHEENSQGKDWDAGSCGRCARPLSVIRPKFVTSSAIIGFNVPPRRGLGIGGRRRQRIAFHRKNGKLHDSINVIVDGSVSGIGLSRRRRRISPKLPDIDCS
jgi:hypothetical protein